MAAEAQVQGVVGEGGSDVGYIVRYCNCHRLSGPTTEAVHAMQAVPAVHAALAVQRRKRCTR